MPENVRVVKKTKDGAEAKTLRIERSPIGAFQTIYSNNLQITLTYFDIKIVFGEVSAVTDDTLRVLDKAAVYMSPEHASALYRILGEQLQKYRDRFGDIRPEPGLPSSETTA